MEFQWNNFSKFRHWHISLRSVCLILTILFVCASYLNRIQVWAEVSGVSIRNISSNTPYTVFVTINGDIYVDNGYANNRVDKWAFNTTNSVSVMYVKSTCWGLFVDINNNIYCSMLDYHQVVTNSLIDNSDMWTIAAGTDCSGRSTSSTLTNPRGIYVDFNLNLYVADFGNNRIQKFLPNQVDAITIVGATVSGTISLSGPTGIVLDGNGYLFIADCWNLRIVGSGPNGYRCVAGCSGIHGTASNQLYYPTSVNFDTYGNMIVADDWNNRIQKFSLITSISSGKCNRIFFHELITKTKHSNLALIKPCFQCAKENEETYRYFA